MCATHKKKKERKHKVRLRTCGLPVLVHGAARDLRVAEPPVEKLDVEHVKDRHRFSRLEACALVESAVHDTSW